MSRRTRRLIVTGVAAVVLAGCQVTVSGTGSRRVPDLRGTATCAVPAPASDPDRGATIVRADLAGTGDELRITIELSEPPAGIEDLGVEVDSSGDVLDVGVTFPDVDPPFQYTADPTGHQHRLTTSPAVDGTTVTYSVAAGVVADIGPEFRWYAYNTSLGAVDTCPPTPAAGRRWTTMRFPPP